MLCALLPAGLMWQGQRTRQVRIGIESPPGAGMESTQRRGAIDVRGGPVLVTAHYFRMDWTDAMVGRFDESNSQHDGPGRTKRAVRSPAH